VAYNRRTLMTGSIATAALGLTGCIRTSRGVRIGFVVKQPEEQWFQDEWRFAEQAAKALDFSVIRIGAPDGDRVLSAMDTLYARHAQGIVICTPDPILGTAIRLHSARRRLKLMSVDDRLVGADGKPIEAIPHVGISGRKIGELAGTRAIAEAKRRGWDIATTGVLRISFNSLETAVERTMGARDAIVADAFPAARIFDAPQRTTDTEGGFTAANPVITRQSEIRSWVILGLNDEAVLGGVRAAEGAGFAADKLIGVGIGGSGSAVAEFTKPGATGFWASILLSPRRHGYDTAAAMHRWITTGDRPPLLTLTSGEVMDRGNFRTLVARDSA
jgi:L-arabinose transport system substrate-binding protein